LNSIGHPTIVGSEPPAPAGERPDHARWSAVLHDESQTQAVAARLARCPALGQLVLALHGDLGAGKTTFVRHLLRALGVPGRIKSPTYTVVEPHEAPWPTGWPAAPAPAVLNIWHFDFYRFSDPREWEDAGFRELFAQPGLKLCEWPEKARGAMPEPDIDLHLQAMPETEDARRLTLHARHPAALPLLEALK
jgi:tRNA threonylcarbamoyladenosine biosynthesis protein TsaE